VRSRLPGAARSDSHPAGERLSTPRRVLRAAVVCYLSAASFYAVQIPAGKGPDETAHLRYVEFLAREHRLPVFPKVNPGADYEFHQPPLYYLLCLPSYLAFGSSGEAKAQGVRLFSALLSVALLYLTFALARALAPERPWAAVGAAVLVGFVPMHLYLSASVSNDVLTEIWFAAALLVMVRHLAAADCYRSGESDRPPGISAMVGMGALIGLGLLTKSLAVVLLPVGWVTAAVAARGRERYEWGRLGREAAAITLVALAIAGWWLWRNQQLYGDLLAQKAFLSAFTDRPSPQGFMERSQVGPVGYSLIVVLWTAASVLGVFGPVSGNRFVFLPQWAYVMGALAAAAGLVGFARYLRMTALARWQRQAWWVCAFVTLLMVAVFVRFNLSFFQAQARYMFPGALPAAAVALSLGLEGGLGKRLGRGPLVIVVAALALLALAALPLWVIPPFEQP